MKFKDYLRMTLGLRAEDFQPTVKVRKAKSIKKSESEEVTSDEGDGQTIPSIRDQASRPLLNRIVIIITWFMIALALISLGAIIYFGIVEQVAPPILSEVLWGTLGYLGGVLASYASFATSSE